LRNLTAKKEEFHTQQSLLSFLKNNKGTILPVIIVFCLPVLLYLQTIFFGIIGLDETAVISRNISFLSDFRNVPQAFLKDIFFVKSSYFYRPLQTLSYMVDIQLSGGDNAWMYHLVNILLFGLIACLLFLLLRKFFIPVKLALISTLIYCAHPLFISFIAWISARGDLLLTLFSLLSFLFFIEYLQKKKIVYFFLNWITFTMALFCKESAVFLPLLFILYYFTYAPEKRFEKKYLFNLVLYALSGIFWFWLRSLSIKSASSQQDIGLIPFISSLPTIPESLANFFLSLDISLIPRFSLFKTLTGLVIISLMLILFFINKERAKKEKIFFLSWFLLLMLPAMLVKEDFIPYLSHRLFFPLIGILLFVLFSLPKQWLAERDIKLKILINGVYICIFATLSALTLINSRIYSDPMTFYNSSISQNPHNSLLYNNRGNLKNTKGDFQGAIEDFTQAIELTPDSPDFYYNRGNAYKTLDNLALAIKDYDKAIELNPDFEIAYYNRGLACSSQGDIESAIRDFDKAIELNPHSALAYSNRGNAYLKKGNPGMAIEDYNKAIELNPNSATTYYTRGNAYGTKGELASAIKDYVKALALNPHYAEAYNNLGLAYQAGGDLESALKEYNKSIELKPGQAEAYYNRGNCYLLKGDYESAIKDYNKAIEARPGYADAYGNRGIAYSAKGDLDAAIRDYNKALALNPQDADVYDNMGYAYKAKGLLQEADRYFKISKELMKSQ
jgi:tetratricopeptide (TPR) repeat protein